MSASELRQAAETLCAEWEPEDGDTAEGMACAQSLMDLINECAKSYDDLPLPVAARALTLARIVNGGESR